MNRPAPSWQVRVVIPARNEQDHLAACLDSVTRAVRELESARRGAGTSATVTVVLDACTDRSADVVARFPRVEALETVLGNVGAARAAGVDHATRYDGPLPIWLAHTDADTVVPPHWLTRQLDLADAGHDAVVGTVEPDHVLVGPLRALWHSRHHLGEGHTHVHGANLGLTLEAYRAVGGFGPLGLHEDVHLVDRLTRAGAHLARTDRVRVRTSSRRTGRTVAGFAGYLRDLDRAARAVDPVVGGEAV